MKCWLFQRQRSKEHARSSARRINHWRSRGILPLLRIQQDRIDCMVTESIRQVQLTPSQRETFSLEPGTHLPCGLLDSWNILPATTLPVSTLHVRRSKVRSTPFYRAKQCNMKMQRICTRWAKKVIQRNLHITSSNTVRFSKFFHCHVLREIWNKAVIKYPTSPQTCCHTTLWNTYVSKLVRPQSVKCVTSFCFTKLKYNEYFLTFLVNADGNTISISFSAQNVVCQASGFWRVLFSVRLPQLAEHASFMT